MGDKSKVMRKKRLLSSEKTEIISAFKAGVSAAHLASKYDVSKTAIYDIVRHLGTPKDKTRKVYARIHPLELRAMEDTFKRYEVKNRSLGLRKLIRECGGFFEDRDDTAAEWVKIRRQVDGMATNLNQIAKACNQGKVSAGQELPGLYKEMSRNYLQLKHVLNVAFNAVDRQAMFDHRMKKIFNE